jgi:tetratricopeptide (TPR) repeat protein
VPAARETGDPAEVGNSILCLGFLAVERGELQAARAYLEEGLTIGTETGRDHIVASAHNALGDVARLEGASTAARRSYEQALAIWRRAGNQSYLGNVLFNLGAVALEEDSETAQASFEEVLSIGRELESKETMGFALDGLAAVAARRGAWERAARLAAAGEALREASGYELERADRAFRDRYLAEVRAALGEAAFAERVAEGRTMTVAELIRLAGEG